MGKGSKEEDMDKGRSDFGKKENKQPGDSTEDPAEKLTENCADRHRQ